MLVQRDELRAHARIQETFQRFGKTIRRYHGTLRELRGDALLTEFDRTSAAVSAALAFQSEQSEYNAQLDGEIRPQLRIGVALGEVIIADHTITGEGVVLAQRLEQLAQPGGLCITPAIREALPKRLPFKLENLGERELKGFDEAVGVYSVSLLAGAAMPIPEQGSGKISSSGSRGPAIAISAVLAICLAIAAVLAVNWNGNRQPGSRSAVTAADSKPTIAVLPFDNMSGDPEQEYFADGITEDLTTDLSRISGLFVVARNSSFTYKGRSVDVRTVSEELGVRYVLEGSVRRSGDQIRINAQLIDASSGVHLWAERFDGTMADVFKLQDSVNRSIVAALEVSLTAADERRFDRIETTSLDAYDLMLRGIEEYNRFTGENIVQARVLFEQAARLDPAYARAYANIALTYATEVNFQWIADREESIRLGLEYASRALALDDSIPQIYLTRSILYLSQRQHQAALEAAQRTVEVHSNYADGQATLAFIQCYSGKLEEALESLDLARQLNPQGTGVYLAIQGRVLFLMKRYEDAIPVLEVARERNPAFDRIHLHLAATLAELGRLDDAAWAVDEAPAISPYLSLARERRESLYLKDSDRDHYIEALRKAGLPE